MNRYALACVALASACGSTEDDRPATLDFITETILAPSCASAECHSAFKREVGDQFDTPAAARRTFIANGLVIRADRENPGASFLVTTLTIGNPSILDPGSGNVRMPYDAPLPDADIELIKRWIADGIPGAQCEPNEQNRGCEVTGITDEGLPRYAVVECIDGNVGAVVTMCAPNESCSLERNGECVAH